MDMKYKLFISKSFMFLKNTHRYDTMVTIKKRGISCQKQIVLLEK